MSLCPCCCLLESVLCGRLRECGRELVSGCVCDRERTRVSVSECVCVVPCACLYESLCVRVVVCASERMRGKRVPLRLVRPRRWLFSHRPA